MQNRIVTKVAYQKRIHKGRSYEKACTYNSWVSHQFYPYYFKNTEAKDPKAAMGQVAFLIFV